ncbi:hypothetical protein MAFF241648_14540 [Ralstonia solanacearum]|nr:hypothetical protein MAFF241648_14540 [Ralstonia solanacearum]
MKYAIIRTQQPGDSHCRHWLPRGTLVQVEGPKDSYGNTYARSVFDVDSTWCAIPRGKISQRVSPYDMLTLPGFVGRALSFALKRFPRYQAPACLAVLSLALR